MYVRSLNGDEYPAQITYTVESEINTNPIMSATIQPTNANLAFLEDMSEVWHIVDDEDTVYVPIYFKKKGIGQHMQADIKAIPLFFDEMNVQRIYERYDQSFTAHAYFTLIFADSGYGFMLHDAFPAQSFQGVGEGATRLDEFKRGIERYGIEFEIVGATVHLKRLIGNDTQFRYEYRLNASNIVQEVDANELWTYARGYGDYGDGEGGEDWQNAKLFREYTSPLATLIGKRDAPPIKNGNITTASTMDEQLRILVNDSLKISATADIHSLEKQGYPIAQAQLGDRSFLIDGRIDFDEEVRVVRKRETRNWKGELIGLDLTFGSPGIVRRHQSKLEGARKEITDFLAGKTKLPFNSLDEAVKRATQIIVNDNANFEYAAGYVLGVNEDNPNLLTRLTSQGLGISSDGGATFPNAITGEGIVADAINVGTLRGILVEAVEMYGSYIEGTEIVGGEFFSGTEPNSYTRILENFIENRGVYTRTWRGTTETHDVTWKLANGYFRVENPEKQRALSFLDDGISTFADGDGGGSSSGTIEFFSRRFGSVNGLTAYSSGTFGVDAAEIVLQSRFSQMIESNESQVYFRPNRTNRPGNNTFALSVLNETAENLTDGFMAYGSTANGYASGLRFSKRAAEPTIWAVDGNLARYGTTKIGAGYFTGYMAMSHTGENFYLGSTSEIRSVRATDYQNGAITYIDHRAANFHNASSITYKTDFKKPELSGLYVMNKLNVVDYILYSDLEQGDYGSRQIGVISELSPEIATQDGLAINLYKGWAYNVMATQELSVEVTKNKSDIAGIHDVLGALIEDVRQLKELESA